MNFNEPLAFGRVIGASAVPLAWTSTGPAVTGVPARPPSAASAATIKSDMRRRMGIGRLRAVRYGKTSFVKSRMMWA
jgi:hypothetical protein